MSRDAVSQEVHHQDSAGHKQNSTLCVDIITLCAVNITGHHPGQMVNTLHTQLLREILLRRANNNNKKTYENTFRSEIPYVGSIFKIK